MNLVVEAVVRINRLMPRPNVGGRESDDAYSEWEYRVGKEVFQEHFGASLLPGAHMLDIGCGIGRNLENLQVLGINTLGVDHNIHSVKQAIHRGFNALHSLEFDSQYNNQSRVFDSFLVSHVLEHMTSSQAEELLHDYLRLLKPDGKVVLITPQESGFASDPTHVEFMDFTVLNKILDNCGLILDQAYSFPFPRYAGSIFKYNEFVVTGRKPT